MKIERLVRQALQRCVQHLFIERQNIRLVRILVNTALDDIYSACKRKRSSRITCARALSPTIESQLTRTVSSSETQAVDVDLLIRKAFAAFPGAQLEIDAIVERHLSVAAISAPFDVVDV